MGAVLEIIKLQLAEAALANAVQEGNAAPRELNDGVHVLSTVRDNKRSSESPKERERRFRDLLGALPAAVYTTDAEGRITYRRGCGGAMGVAQNSGAANGAAPGSYSGRMAPLCRMTSVHGSRAQGEPAYSGHGGNRRKAGRNASAVHPCIRRRFTTRGGDLSVR